jgi:hypothetical protein
MIDDLADIVGLLQRIDREVTAVVGLIHGRARAGYSIGGNLHRIYAALCDLKHTNDSALP